MTTLREAVQQALEALEHINHNCFILADHEGPMEKAIPALKAALMQDNKNDFNPDWDTVKAFDDRHNEDTALLRQCLEAMNRSDYLGWQLNIPIIKALRERLAQPEDDPIVGTKTWFNEEGKIVQQELKRSEVYKQPEDDPVVFNTISSLRHKKTVGPIESAMTGRPQTTMQPCAGRNCGSTNPNLHSAECFEDYEKSTGMSEWKGLTDEEIDDIWNKYCDEMGEASINDAEDIARAIEAKLKEKNA